MDLPHKFVGVEGPLSTDLEMVCIAKAKYSEVRLALCDSLNIPFAEIELFSNNLYKDKLDTFQSATSLGNEIVSRWNAHPKAVHAAIALKKLISVPGSNVSPEIEVAIKDLYQSLAIDDPSS